MATTTIGDSLNSLSIPSQDSAVQAENQIVLDAHADMESFGHDNDLSATTHGLTNFGETFGLGKVGGKNLLTDTAQAPGGVANGATASGEASGLLADSGQTIKAGGDFVAGTSQDLSNPSLVTTGLADGTLDGVGGVGNGGGGEPLVSAGAGTPGSSPILNGGVLAAPNDEQPASVMVGDGQNLANVSALRSADGLNLGGNDSSDHLISGDVGNAGSDSVARAGVLTTSDSQSPLGVDVGNGQNIANADVLPHSDVLSGSNPGTPVVGQDLGNGINVEGLGSPLNLGGSDSNGHLISGDVGNAGSDSVARAGVLTTSDSQSPLGIDVGNGQNIANADVLPHSDVLSGSNPGTPVVGQDLGNGINVEGLGSPLNLGGSDSNGHLISGDVGAAGNDSIAKAGVLTTSDSQSPLGVDVGNGQNIANADLLPQSGVLSGSDPGTPVVGQDLGNGINVEGIGSPLNLGGSDSNGHLISGDVGAAGNDPLATAGVLTTSDSQSPLGIDVGNGQNIASADLLPNSDVLSGSNLGNPIVGQDLGDGVILGNVGNLGGSDSNGHLISGDVGAAGSDSIETVGVLTTGDSQSPVGIDIGNGQNIVNADLLPHSDVLSGSDLGNPIVGQDLGDGVSLGTIGSGSGDPIISVSNGPLGDGLINGGALSTPDGELPISILDGGGKPIGDLAVLGNNDLLNLGGIGGTGEQPAAGGTGSSGDTGSTNGGSTAPGSGGAATGSGDSASGANGSGAGTSGGNAGGTSTGTQPPAGSGSDSGSGSGSGSGDQSASGGDTGSTGSDSMGHGNWHWTWNNHSSGPDLDRGGDHSGAHPGGDNLHFPDMGGSGHDSLAGYNPSGADCGDAGQGRDNEHSNDRQFDAGYPRHDPGFDHNQDEGQAHNHDHAAPNDHAMV